MRLFGWIRRKPAAGDVAMGRGGMPFRVVGGRRRKAGVPYMLPWDIEEHHRLDFQHFMLRNVLRGNYAAPIQEPRDILDVGTGTGRWAIEMANLFPQARVMGVDITPPPVDLVAEAGIAMRPPNYTFLLANVLEGLPFADSSFDFVHMRALTGAIPHDRWPAVIGELVRVTRPGGWVESLEATALEGGGPAVDQLMAWITDTFIRRGIVFADGGTVDTLLRSAGLMQVSVRHLPMPCGDSGDRSARMLAADWYSLLKGIGGMSVALGLTTAEHFNRTFEQARIDLASPNVRCIMPVHIAFGQRAW